MATIFDIAKQAGVSITTVSRALNGYSDVNEKTRRRVVEIAGKLNYYPSAAARSLQGKKTNTIAFAPILRESGEPDPFLKEFIGTMAISCLSHDLSLLVMVATSTQDNSETYRELAGSGRVDGIILADVEPQDHRVAILQELGIPFVAFGRTTDYASLAYPFVDVDGAAGIQELVNYLYEQGHRRIAYLSDPVNSSCVVYRHNGYREALIQHGLEENPQLSIGDLVHEQEIKTAVARLFELPFAEQPTAIVASHDRLALNVLYALRERGLSVGKGSGQIAVSGFDDLPFAAYLDPSLTTLRQPMGAICTILLEMLVAVLKNKSEVEPENQLPGLNWVGPQQVLLRPEFIVRASA